jgi:hypothetical protein
MSRARLLALVLLAACAHRAPPPDPGDGPRLQVAFPPESVDIQGPMPRDVAMNTLHGNERAFASCVPVGAVGASGGRITVGLRLQVGPEGRVRKVELRGSDARDRSIERCMVHRAKEIQFPNGPAQAPSVVTTMVAVSNP